MRFKAKTFRFVSCQYDPAAATAFLRYAADEIEFEEKLVFTGADQKLKPERIETLNHILYYLHIAAGISYYKAFIPDIIKVETRPLSESAARFFDQFYLNGLGEFAYKNKLNLSGRIKFPWGETTQSQSLRLDLKRRTAVPIGGGKDSAVTLETLMNIDEPAVGLSVGLHNSIVEIAAIADVPLFQIRRYLSPKLFDLNAQGALNGHVPIVGILSFIFLVAAILYDFDAIAMSNERSANSGNIQYDGREINHQWSKSSDFETALQRLLKDEICEGINYFSILRPLSEFQIAQLFADMPKYHQAFTSCNRAFKINERTSSNWCCECDKCRFVFLILSPFLQIEELLKIFGKNLFDKMTYLPEYKTLLGLEGYKPFECVGEFEESQAALYLLQNCPDWAQTPVIKGLIQEVNQKKIDLKNSFNNSSKIQPDHLMPQPYQNAIYEITRITGQKHSDLGRRT